MIWVYICCTLTVLICCLAMAIAAYFAISVTRRGAEIALNSTPIDGPGAARDVSTPLSISYNPPNLPPFCESATDLWFVFVKNIFARNNIDVDNERLELTMRAMSVPVLERVRSLILDRNNLSYGSLKAALLSVFSYNSENKFQEFMGSSGFTGLKPTEILAKQRSCAAVFSDNGHFPNSLLKKLFLDKLPNNIAAILLALDIDDLDGLAKRADQLCKLSDSTIVDSAGDVKKTSTSCSSESTSFNSSQLRSPRTTGSPPQPNYHNVQKRLCRYHQQFGRRAFRCVQPCDWIPEREHHLNTVGQ